MSLGEGCCTANTEDADCPQLVSDPVLVCDLKSRKRKQRDRITSDKKRTKHQLLTHDATETSTTNFDNNDIQSVKNYTDTVESNELKNVPDKMDDKIERSAEKNKLTPQNVKSILRHVITNEYVLTMVQNTMKSENNDSDELDESSFEPKLTRSKAKELREKQYTLPWPVSSPIKKKETLSKKILEEEFSDENSSDEDYKPNDDDCASEEELLLPKSVESEFTTNPVIISEELATDENGDAVTKETFNDDGIALRTRSKLSLNDTSLEAIEASFVAPDITVDMYDTNCDNEEWKKFLRELSKPFDSEVVVQPLGGEVDDADDDPEYNFLEEEEPDEMDLQYDKRNVKITRDELSDLMAEILETAQHEYNDCDEDDENAVYKRTETPCVPNVYIDNVESQWMNFDERLQLEEQMRMYVQLLTQSYLLSFGIPELTYINVSAKLFLDEIKMFALRENATNTTSAFYAHNLDDALGILDDYENNRSRIQLRNSKSNKSSSNKHSMPSYQVQKTMLDSKVFIYPELLPATAFQRQIQKKKTYYCAAEDHLIALGLEQFSSCENPVHYISSLLVPTKTEYQLKIRIKNCKNKVDTDNPIRYFHVHKEAPPLQRVIRIFDPHNVKTPKEYPLDILPKWSKTLCSISPSSNMPLIAPSQNTSISSPVAVSPIVCKAPDRKRYSPILPRVSHISPLKQISPILRKYNQQRRIIPVIPFNANSACKVKPLGFTKRQGRKLPMLQPKPSVLNFVETSPIKAPEQSKTTILSNQNFSTTVRNDEINGCLTKNTSIVCTSVTTNATESEKIQSVVTAKNNESQLAPEGEVSEEPDEEVDDEQDLAALMAASSTICKKQQSASKKRNKLQRDLEASLTLLQPNLIENDPKKEEREALFANSYLLRVTEALKNDSETCEKFLKVLCKHQYSARSPVKLYFELKEILKDYPGLADDFIAFLHPEQAKDCGKYKEYVILRKIREFLRKIEIHFSNQPQHLLKILKTFAQLRRQTDLTSSVVLNALQPLLRNQSHLMEELSHLCPDASPPEYLMTDFEDITIPNTDEDNSSMDSCEELVIPDTPDPYGGKDCPCDCHKSSTETRMLNRTRHCIKCGIKFLDGRIYIQTGKVLKPAQVLYHNLSPESSCKEKTSATTQICSKIQQTSEMTNLKTSAAADFNNKLETNSSKKDLQRTSFTEQRPVLPCSDDTLPSSSKLPCDVIEDTVFPTVTNVANKSLPSDFSHLRELIGHSKQLNNQDEGASDESKQLSKDNSQLICQGQVKESSGKTVKWNSEEDKLIIYNCQRFGISKKAFQSTAITLESRTAEEVESRFIHLMKFLSKEAVTQ
ncbi:GON-4-like protein isoform X2 [Stegodyphus dumicola]|uniref:GON-4-like protein isoform X2 n=1 Tax=Stegodyphus dumicola TaxID=202533 RepID=UPI0015AE40EF|nr:GON-4-like protein isoform X2 [Stegodyphus dumicola]